MRDLLDSGANVNARDASGNTALILALGGEEPCMQIHGAITESGAEIADALINTDGVDVNLRDTTGRTALMIAAWYGSLPLTEALIREGADVNAALTSDNCPPDCYYPGQAPRGKYVAEDYTRIWATTEGGTALMMAAARGHVGIVLSLLQAGTNAAAKTYPGKPNAVGKSARVIANRILKTGEPESYKDAYRQIVIALDSADPSSAAAVAERQTQSRAAQAKEFAWIVADVTDGRVNVFNVSKIERACSDEQYMAEFFSFLRSLDRKRQRAFYSAVCNGPTCLYDRTRSFLEEQSKPVAFFPNPKTKVLNPRWLLLTLFASVAIQVLFFATLPPGFGPPLERASGLWVLLVIVSGIGATISFPLLFIGTIAWVDRRIARRWYSSQLNCLCSAPVPVGRQTVLDNVCPECRKCVTIDHDGRQWCPDCGDFVTPPNV